MIKYNTKRYWGYSNEIKPKYAQIGDRYLELDTKIEYVFDEYNQWYSINSSGNSVSGDFLPLSGGTVTGGTIFQSGLTANTISATTYYNLPYSGTLTGGGTTGYLPKWTGSTGLGDSLVYDATTGVTIGTGFTWDNTNTRLGIGTNTPTSPLFIYTNTTSPTIGDNNAFIIHNNNPNWATSGSSNLTELFFSDAGQGSGTANGLNLGHRYAGISAFITGWNNTNSSGGLNFITKETTASALTTKLQIRPNGNVLIGTTTDAGYKLDVNGSARSTNFRLTDNTLIATQYSVGSTTLTISNGGHNNAVGVKSTSAVGVHAISSLGVSNNNLLGASVYAAGGAQSGNISLGLLSNRALITSAATGMGMQTSAMLQVDSTSQGFLPPRMTSSQRDSILSASTGLTVYQTTDNYLSLFNGTNWQNILSPNSAGNVLIGKTTDSGQKLQVSGNTLLQGSLTATTKTTIGSESDISCALLQMASTTQGVLFPRMTNAQRQSISSPIPGLFVYCTDDDGGNNREGLFMYKSTGWVQII